MPVWDAAIHNANIEQLQFQVAAMRLRERRNHRLSVDMTETSFKILRQTLIDFLGLDLLIPSNERKRDGTGAAIALPLISNSPELAKWLREQARRGTAETDALADAAKDKYAQNLMAEALGEDSGDEHAKIDAKLASLSVEELAQRSRNAGRRDELLRIAGIDTIKLTSEELDGPVLEWDEALKADQEQLQKAQDAIDNLPSDRLFDEILGGTLGLDPEDL